MKEKTRRAGDHEHTHSDLSDDLALIQSFQNGRDRCFEALFARYWKLVFAIAWKILHQLTAPKTNIHAGSEIPGPITLPSFGKIFNTVQSVAGYASGGPGDPRLIQFALKFKF